MVDAGPDQTIDEGGPVDFSGSFADVGLVDTHTIEWNFGDGTTASGTLTPSHTYADNGVYTVMLTVTDDDGGVGANTLVVTVGDLGPAAAFTWSPEPQNEGGVVSFSDMSTSAPDSIVSWSWDFDGLATSDAQNPSFRFMDDGSYVVSLTVTDDDGSMDTVSHTVTITDLGPTAILNGDVSLEEGQIGIFDASGSSSSPDALVQYEWDWDYSGTAFSPSGDLGQIQSHAWTEDGVYIVALRVTDEDGSIGLATLEVTVADLTAPMVSVDELSTNDPTPALRGSVDDPDATIRVSVGGAVYGATNHGDGTWSLADDAIAPALADGTYDVSVEATDPAGNIGTDDTTDELVIDATAPVVTANALTTPETSPELTGTVDDPMAAVVVTVGGKSYSAVNDGSGWSLAPGTISPSLAPAAYDIDVRAADPVGNVGTYTLIGGLVIEEAGPAVPAAVDGLVSVSMGATRFDRRTSQTSIEVVVSNTSETVITGPVWIVIGGISDSTVTLAASDGLIGALPYIDLTGFLGDGRLDPGESVTTRVYFNNPLRRRFTFSYSIWGVAEEEDDGEPF
jgi:PKD repeat protein